MFASIPVIGNSLPILPPLSIMSLASAPALGIPLFTGSLDSSSPVCWVDERANVLDGDTEGIACSSFEPEAGEPEAGDLKAGPDRSLVWALLDIALIALESDAFLRSRAGVAGLGTLVDVVNEGGAGSGPSILAFGL
jgi:hypothetical protein